MYCPADLSLSKPYPCRGLPREFGHLMPAGGQYTMVAIHTEEGERQVQGEAEGGREAWQDRQQGDRNQAVASSTGIVPAPLLRRKSQGEDIHEAPVQIQTGPEEKGSGDWWRGSRSFLAVFSGAWSSQVPPWAGSEAPVVLPVREDALTACWGSAHSLRQKKAPVCTYFCHSTVDVSEPLHIKIPWVLEKPHLRTPLFPDRRTNGVTLSCSESDLCGRRAERLYSQNQVENLKRKRQPHNALLQSDI